MRRLADSKEITVLLEGGGPGRGGGAQVPSRAVRSDPLSLRIEGILALLERENEKLLDRQERMYTSRLSLWKRWERGCDFLHDDLPPGG